MKFAIAIHEKPDGSLEVIKASGSVQACIDAYKSATAPGKYHLCDSIHFDRSKRISSTVAPVAVEFAAKIKPTKKL